MTDINDFIKRYGIGLTGGIATGKSTVAKIIAANGINVFDADQLARDVVQLGAPALADIAAAFGSQILTKQGALDRAALGRVVFNDPNKRRQLEAILHPAIADALAASIRSCGLTDKPRYFFYDAALLFEAKTAHRFREIWVTSCAPQTQLERLMQRNKIDASYAQAMINQQLPLAEKEALADVIIWTDNDAAAVEQNVRRLLAERLKV